MDKKRGIDNFTKNLSKFNPNIEPKLKKFIKN